MEEYNSELPEQSCLFRWTEKIPSLCFRPSGDRTPYLLIRSQHLIDCATGLGYTFWGLPKVSQQVYITGDAFPKCLSKWTLHGMHTKSVTASVHYMECIPKVLQQVFITWDASPVSQQVYITRDAYQTCHSKWPPHATKAHNITDGHAHLKMHANSILDLNTVLQGFSVRQHKTSVVSDPHAHLVKAYLV
jgi:hypothetical protein